VIVAPYNQENNGKTETGIAAADTPSPLIGDVMA
jgi:hypothetical protein